VQQNKINLLTEERVFDMKRVLSSSETRAQNSGNETSKVVLDRSGCNVSNDKIRNTRGGKIA
jgi:hypothetical protein